MAKVLVLYYSSYGHVEQMADAVADGARAAGAEVDIRRVAETAPAAVVEVDLSTGDLRKLREEGEMRCRPGSGRRRR